MAESLFLNKIQVDIRRKPITRKIQIGDIGEIESWKSSFSYTVELPKTSRNKQVFDMLGTVGNTSRKPFEEVTCDYVVNGIYLVSNGFAVIRETAKNYSVNIINGVKSLSSALGTKKLTDLDLTSLNHNLTAQSFVDSFVNTGGYIYGIAHCGQPNQINVLSTFDASSSVLEIFSGSHSVPLELISNSEGSGGKDVASTSGLTGEENSFYKVISETSALSIQTDFEIDFDININGVTIEVRLKQFRDAVLHDNRLLDSQSGDSGEIASFDFDIAEVFNDVEEDDYFILTVTGNLEDFDSRIPYLVGVSLTGDTYFKVEKQVPSIFVHTLISAIFAQNNLTLEGDFFTANLDYLNEVVTLSEGFSITSVGQLIEPGDYLGEINQIDLIKDVSNRYGLVLLPDGDKYTFINLESILADKENAEDWTDKLSGISYERYESGYAKTNTASFNYAEAIDEKNYDGELLIDNENAENEESLFSSFFEIPDIYGKINIYDLYNIPVWSISEGIVKDEKTPIKVMTIRKEDIDIDFKMLDNATVVNETEDIPLLSLENISLQNSLDVYYPSFKNAIDNYAMLLALINLSVIDIYNLDFSRLKYLKQTGRYYYLNAVQNTAGEISKVNLLKV